MAERPTVLRRDVIGWSLWDFANTIYSMNIVSLYLKRYIVQDLGYDDRYYDIPFSISMLLAAILLPALGAMSDHSTKKKVFVMLFTISCCMAVGLMAYIPASMIFAIMILFIIANFSYEAGMPFYNALLYSVADGQEARFVSGYGVAWGYVGSIVGMALVMPFVTGSLYGIDIPFMTGEGKVGAFVPTAVLFFVFSIPLFLWVKEAKVHLPKRATFGKAYREVWAAVRQTKQYPGVLRFLIADYFFEDAAATVIINIGLYSSIVLGLSEVQTNVFLLVATVSAVLGSLLIGKISERRSLKNTLWVVVWGGAVALIVFVATENMAIIWILGSLVGIFLGGLWTTTRPMLAEMVPRAELGRFFGLFALSGRAAAIVGPIVWTLSVYYFQPTRPLGKYAVELFNLSSVNSAKLPYKVGVLSLVIMLFVGLIIFRKVPHTGRNQHG